MLTESSGKLERVLKIIGTIVTVGSLLFALAQFMISQSIEAKKPYLEKKLAWCEEATNTAAAISVRDREQVTDKEMRFWELYWGVMGLVENKEVTAAMIAFGKGLNGTIPEGESLRTLSLDIAHACRQELARDWSPAWGR
jgi:hypothetical protein